MEFLWTDIFAVVIGAIWLFWTIAESSKGSKCKDGEVEEPCYFGRDVFSVLGVTFIILCTLFRV